MLFVVGFARTTHSPNAQGKKSLQTDIYIAKLKIGEDIYQHKIVKIQ